MSLLKLAILLFVIGVFPPLAPFWIGAYAFARIPVRANHN